MDTLSFYLFTYLPPALYLLISFLVAFAIGIPIVNYLRQVKAHQVFRQQGPESHLKKIGTPTMGGWIFLVPILLASIYIYFFSDVETYDGAKPLGILLIAGAILAGAVLGAIDDGVKLFQANYAGLNSKVKLLAQALIALIVVIFSGRIEVFSLWSIFEFVWAFLVIAGASNAVNLTDGLDGLASSVSIFSFIGLTVSFYSFASFNEFYLCLAIIGALGAFLIYNRKPALIFMGDTGSLALGMGLGVIAYINRLEWFLLAFAAVPVFEAISVILQVASAKLSRKFLDKDLRIFKMAPFHHHLELVGFKETDVVWMLTVAQAIASIIGLMIIVN